MNRRYFLTRTAGVSAALAATGCASLTPANIRLGADTALLQGEFNAARERLIAVPFNESQMPLVTNAIGQLDKARHKLARLSTGHEDGVQVLIDYTQGVSLLDEIAGAYGTLKAVYLEHLRDTGVAPDPFLVSYATSAENVYAGLVDAAEQAGVFNVPAVTGYLAYVLRGYALYRTGGVVG